MKTAEQALLDVLNIVRRYLPPDGINVKDAMSEIIACVDPWPLVPTQPPAASQPVIAVTVKRWCETCEGDGYVFQEPQAGCHVDGDHPCPDCDGKGYWVPAQPPAASQPSDEQIADAVPLTATVLEIEGERLKVCMTKTEVLVFARTVLALAAVQGKK